MQFGDEAVVITIVLGTTLIIFFAVIIVFLFVLFNNKNKLNSRDKEMTKKEFEENLLQARLEIREETLRHIGYELHDNIGQIASLIKINLYTINIENDREAALAKIEATKDLVRELITDLKSLSMSLNSNRIAQIGICQAMEEEVLRLNKTGQFQASLTIEGSHPRIRPDHILIVYRMMQEVINNVVKHSGASVIAISICTAENLCILECRDNGTGFDPQDKFRSGSGAGLINLQNRARMIDAVLTIQSSTGNGTTVTIELPQ